MSQRTIVMAAAWLEIVVGAIILLMPDVACVLLFAAKAEGAAMPLARFAGVALIALGIASLPSKATGSGRAGVWALFIFNFGVAVLLAWVGIATTLRGLLLWPASILHAVIAIVLFPHVLGRGLSNS